MTKFICPRCGTNEAPGLSLTGVTCLDPEQSVFVIDPQTLCTCQKCYLQDHLKKYVAKKHLYEAVHTHKDFGEGGESRYSFESYTPPNILLDPDNLAVYEEAVASKLGIDYDPAEDELELEYVEPELV